MGKRIVSFSLTDEEWNILRAWSFLETGRSGRYGAFIGRIFRKQLAEMGTQPDVAAMRQILRQYALDHGLEAETGPPALPPRHLSLVP